MGVPVRSPRWKVASAFLVSKKHIDVLVAARHPAKPGAENLPRPAKDAWSGTVFDHMSDDALGQMLWDENQKSLDARYGGSRPEVRESMGVGSKLPKYRFNMPHEKLSHAVVFKAIHCYEYQSNEHEGWNSSEAKKYCEALSSSLVRTLPGYDEAPWGIA